MSPMPKRQALLIVRSCLWYFYLNKVIFAVLDVPSLPLQKFFYINICGFISRDTFLYETRVLDNSTDLKFSFPPLIVQDNSRILKLH